MANYQPLTGSRVETEDARGENGPFAACDGLASIFFSSVATATPTFRASTSPALEGCDEELCVLTDSAEVALFVGVQSPSLLQRFVCGGNRRAEVILTKAGGDVVLVATKRFTSPRACFAAKQLVTVRDIATDTVLCTMHKESGFIKRELFVRSHFPEELGDLRLIGSTFASDLSIMYQVRRAGTEQRTVWDQIGRVRFRGEAFEVHCDNMGSNAIERVRIFAVLIAVLPAVRMLYFEVAGLAAGLKAGVAPL